MLDHNEEATESNTEMTDLECRLSETIERLLKHGEMMVALEDRADREVIFKAMIRDAHEGHLGKPGGR